MGTKIKPWQIVVFIAAIGALGWSIWSVLSRDRIPQADEVVMVDVLTGELFVQDTSRAIVMPAKHPDTGEYSLLPVYEEDGQFRMSSRSASLLGRIDGPKDAVDANSLVVTVTNPGAPRRIKRD